MDDSLLKILACPACKANVVRENDNLICQSCKKKYPIKNGIPIMLVEEAQIDEDKSEK